MTWVQNSQCNCACVCSRVHVEQCRSSFCCCAQRYKHSISKHTVTLSICMHVGQLDPTHACQKAPCMYQTQTRFSIASCLCSTLGWHATVDILRRPAHTSLLLAPLSEYPACMQGEGMCVYYVHVRAQRPTCSMPCEPYLLHGVPGWTMSKKQEQDEHRYCCCGGYDDGDLLVWNARPCLWLGIVGYVPLCSHPNPTLHTHTCCACCLRSKLRRSLSVASCGSWAISDAPPVKCVSLALIS